MKESSQHSVNATSQQEIARTAYQLWDQAGRPSGRNMEFWLKAEQQHTGAGRLLLPNPSVRPRPGAEFATADPAAWGIPATTPDQAHADQFFESLRSIKFTNAPKLAAAPASTPVAAPQPKSTLLQKPNPMARTAKSQPKRAAASAKAMRNGK